MKMAFSKTVNFGDGSIFRNGCRLNAKLFLGLRYKVGFMIHHTETINTFLLRGGIGLIMNYSSPF